MKKDKYGNNCSKRLPVAIHILGAIKFDYFIALTFAKKLYGKHGILFDELPGSCLALNKIDQVKLAVIDGACKWDQNNNEQDDLHALVRTSKSHLNVFIVGGIKTSKGSLAGCGGHAPNKPAAVVSGTLGTNFTLAHEIGHVLLTAAYSPVHDNSPSNIMVSGTWRIPAGSSPDFDATQITQIMKNPLLVNI